MSHALTVPTHDRVTDVTLRLLDHIFSPPRAFTIRLWNGLTLPAAGQPSFGLVLNHRAALRRMFTPPVELSLGESFIYGDFDIEGDIFAAFTLFNVIFRRNFSLSELVAMLRDLLALPKNNRPRWVGRGPVHLSGSIHSRERDRAACQRTNRAGQNE